MDYSKILDTYTPSVHQTTTETIIGYELRAKPPEKPEDIKVPAWLITHLNYMAALEVRTLKTYNKVLALKMLRQVLGLSLAQAKWAFDAMIDAGVLCSAYDLSTWSKHFNEASGLQ
jgi:ribosomal protein L7/L12